MEGAKALSLFFGGGKVAFLNGLYIFVKNEDLNSDMEVSSHSVEQGINITDTVKKNAEELSISGEIVDYSVGGKDYKSWEVLSQITALKNAGALITYNGRCALTNMLIKNFSTGRTNEVSGACTFEMTLQECRIVTNAYGVSTASTSGTQQVDKNENKEVWYTVKKGDTIYELVVAKKVNGRLVTADYANLIRKGQKGKGGMSACNWVMSHNMSAFSRRGDFRTLKIGAKILLGERR